MFEKDEKVYHTSRLEEGIFVEYIKSDIAYVYFDSEGCELLVSIEKLIKFTVD